MKKYILIRMYFSVCCGRTSTAYIERKQAVMKQLSDKDFTKSHALLRESNRCMVGGVSSPVRAFNSVGGRPFLAESGKGSRLRDVDGNEYIDYVLSWGPLAMGHAYPAVVEAVQKAMESGSSFGVTNESEIRLAERIAAQFKSIDLVRFVNSGTEAVMSAVRLARAFVGCDYVVKVEGGYHGHSDSMLVKAGSGLAARGIPNSPGVPNDTTKTTIVIPYNDLNAAKEVFDECGDDIACLIIEPLPGNMGLVLPDSGYLEGLRQLTKWSGSLLIFDEVMSGFRAHIPGAQQRYKVKPDITILGKVIGGGLPVGAYGGPAEIMAMMAPEGPVYQAGTLSGNPLAMAAGIATLDALLQEGVFASMESRMLDLCKGIKDAAKETGVPVYQTRVGSMGCTFFNESGVGNYSDAASSNTETYAKFFWGMLRRGVYLPPSQFETYFMSAAHTDADIDKTLQAACDTLKDL